MSEAHELPAEFLGMLEAIVGASNLRTGERIAELDPGVHPDNLKASAVLAPASTEEVAEIVRACQKWRVPIVSQGGRTGLVGGGISCPGQIVLSLSRMNVIERIIPVENIAIVQSGVVLQQFQTAAAEYGLEPGIDLAARGSATIGGMISTNAGGVMSFRNGVMRQRILGLEAVLPDGSIYNDMTRVIKNAAGYDLKHLFIGGEGTLGIVTRAVMRLEPQPAETGTALFALPSTEIALLTLAHIRSKRAENLRAAEVMWRRYINFTAERSNWSSHDYDLSAPVHLLLVFGGQDEDEMSALQSDLYDFLTELEVPFRAVVGATIAQQQELAQIREATDEVYRIFPAAPSYDVSVPLSEIDVYLGRCLPAISAIDAELSPFVFGHLADGNLHIILNRAGAETSKETVKSVEDILYSGIRDMGGSFSAEHGVGSKRIHSLYATADPVKLALMKQVKNTLDPNNMLNPGKLFHVD